MANEETERKMAEIRRKIQALQRELNFLKEKDQELIGIAKREIKEILEKLEKDINMEIKDISLITEQDDTFQVEIEFMYLDEEGNEVKE